MVENRISQGLKYGLSCCVVWIVYLLEPLPHVAPLDRITYPIADSLALIVMGLLLGRLFGNPAQQADNENLPFPVLPALTVPACFLQDGCYNISSLTFTLPLMRSHWKQCCGVC